MDVFDDFDLMTFILISVAAIFSILVLAILGYLKLKRIRMRHSESSMNTCSNPNRISKMIKLLKQKTSVKQEMAEDRIHILIDQDESETSELKYWFMTNLFYAICVNWMLKIV